MTKTPAPTVLLTGFAPFGGDGSNPSWEAVRALEGTRIRGHRVVARCLSVEFGRSLRELRSAIREAKPSAVVCVGLAAGRPHVAIERVAINVDDARIPDLRARLAPLGDSLVVVGGDGLWNVHVHVDDVGAAIEAGIDAGRPHRVRVTHFAEQVGARAARIAAERSGRRVVVVAAGEGLGRLFAEAGATVVPGGPGRRPSTREVLDALSECGGAEVVVLPNDRDSVAVVEAAAQTARDELDLRVAVIPTSAQVQGLAALAVHEPGRTFEQDVLEMTAAARHARNGAVTIAARRAMTSGGPCEPGDVLGAVEGDFVVVGDDLGTVATDVVERLLGGGGEMVTLVAGQDGRELAERTAAYLRRTRPTVDVVVYDGGQDRYPLLIGVE